MELTALNFRVTDAIKRHVARRIKSAVGRASGPIAAGAPVAAGA